LNDQFGEKVFQRASCARRSVMAAPSGSPFRGKSPMSWPPHLKPVRGNSLSISKEWMKFVLGSLAEVCTGDSVAEPAANKGEVAITNPVQIVTSHVFRTMLWSLDLDRRI
jgi:hypothetical protein